MTRNYIEDKLQIAVVKHLRSAFPDVLFCHPANQGRNAREGAKLKAMGVLAGTPDLLLWWAKPIGLSPGHINYLMCNSAAIELKSPTGKRSAKQGTFELLFTRIGGKHAYCRSVQGVHNTLIAWGCKPIHGASPEPDTRSKKQKHQDAYDWAKP